jgi:putative copper resistance protein D
MQVDTVVGVVLMVVGHNIFPAYARTGRTWGPAGVADVHDGGVIMWAGSDIVMIVLAVAVAVAFIHGPRSAGRAGGWVEGIRARALLGRAGAGAAQAVPGATGARVAVARARPAAGDIDTDEAWLAAYNAYLAGLGREEPPGQPAAG